LFCRNGVDVRGYFAWAFMDLFEFLGGYQPKYGMYHVDFTDERRPRRGRLSAGWYSAFLKNKKAGNSTVLSKMHDLNQELDAMS
jgi:beta-glucosidase